MKTPNSARSVLGAFVGLGIVLTPVALSIGQDQSTILAHRSQLLQEYQEVYGQKSVMYGRIAGTTCMEHAVVGSVTLQDHFLEVLLNSELGTFTVIATYPENETSLILLNGTDFTVLEHKQEEESEDKKNI